MGCTEKEFWISNLGKFRIHPSDRDLTFSMCIRVESAVRQGGGCDPNRPPMPLKRSSSTSCQQRLTTDCPSADHDCIATKTRRALVPELTWPSVAGQGEGPHVERRKEEEEERVRWKGVIVRGRQVDLKCIRSDRKTRSAAACVHCFSEWAVARTVTQNPKPSNQGSLASCTKHCGIELNFSTLPSPSLHSVWKQWSSVRAFGWPSKRLSWATCTAAPHFDGLSLSPLSLDFTAEHTSKRLLAIVSSSTPSFLSLRSIHLSSDIHANTHTSLPVGNWSHASTSTTTPLSLQSFPSTQQTTTNLGLYILAVPRGPLASSSTICPPWLT